MNREGQEPIVPRLDDEIPLFPVMESFRQSIDYHTQRNQEIIEGLLRWQVWYERQKEDQPEEDSPPNQ